MVACAVVGCNYLWTPQSNTCTRVRSRYCTQTVDERRVCKPLQSVQELQQGGQGGGPRRARSRGFGSGPGRRGAVPQPDRAVSGGQAVGRPGSGQDPPSAGQPAARGDVLVAQGRPDHNDAAVVGDDPAFRLAVSDRAGGGRWRRSPRCRGRSRRWRGRGTWACCARAWPGSRGGGCGR